MSQAVLVDLARLHLRSAARVAHGAMRWRGDPPLDDWLRERLDLSIRELLSEDREEERDGIPLSEPWDPRYAFVSEVLGVEPALSRRACVAFNALAHTVRCAWFAVAVEGKTVHRYVAEGHGPPDKVKADLKLALKTISDATGRPYGGTGGGGHDEI